MKKIIAIVGKVDSRVLTYPLARALSLSGLTAMITYDGAYRRLYTGEEDTGTVSGVDISIGMKSDMELAESLNNSGVPYDYILFISSGYIPPEVDGVILCNGVDKSMMAVEAVDHEDIRDKVNVPDGIPSSSLYISFDTPPKDGTLAINLKDTAIKYIYSCEETKELHLLDDKSLNKLISKIASDVIGITQGELFNLLTRKEYVTKK